MLSSLKSVFVQFLDETSRVRLGFRLCCINVAGVFLALFSIAVCQLFVFTLKSYTELVEGYDGDWLLWQLTYVGTAVVIVNLFNCYICFIHRQPERRPDLDSWLPLFGFLGTFGLLLALFWSASLCYMNWIHANDLFVGGLTTSMNRYRDNLDVKVKLDALQAAYSCCGDTKYTDWFQIAFVPDEFLDTSDPEIRDRIHAGSGYQSDDVPFSCCNSDTRRPCIFNHVHNNNKHFNYDYTKSLTIHVKGCRAVMARFLQQVIVPCNFAIVGAVFLLELVNLWMFRILQTSIKQAMKSGDVTAASYGYLSKWCLPAGEYCIAPTMHNVNFSASLGPTDVAAHGSQQTVVRHAPSNVSVQPQTDVNPTWINQSVAGSDVIQSVSAIQSMTSVRTQAASVTPRSHQDALVQSALSSRRGTPVTAASTRQRASASGTALSITSRRQ